MYVPLCVMSTGILYMTKITLKKSERKDAAKMF